LFFFALMLPVVAYGALRALKSTSNDPRQWLPRSFEETDTYDRFQEHFGADEIAVVSWPGCTLEDPRVPKLAESLTASDYFDRVRTGESVVQELLASSIAKTQQSAVHRLRGSLIGPDDQTTCLILSTSSVGQDDRVAAVAEIERLAIADCGLSVDELRLAGPTVDAAAIDVESRKLLFELAGFSALLSFIVASMRLQSIRMAIIVLVVAMYSTGIALALVYFTGSKMNLLMTMLPPLIYVLSISSAVHLANYYRDATLTAPSTSSALATAISHGWLPCSLAAGTTGIGLISLVMSKIDPIRMFGVFSSVGVTLSVVVLFILLPAAIRLFPPGEPKKSIKSSKHPDASPASTTSVRIVRFITRYHLPVTLGCLAIMLFCGWGLRHLKSTVRLQDRFLPGSDAVEDYRWLEQNIGPMVPLEIVVRFPDDDEQNILDRIQLVAAIQREVHSLDEPVATMSAANLCPPIPQARGTLRLYRRQLLRRKLEAVKDRLVEERMVAQASDGELWRITLRANAIGDLDYGQFADKLRERVDPLLQGRNAEATYTGIIPLIYKAQRQLLQDLARSFLAAFAVIAVVLIVVLRSFTAACLAMIPNLFPAVVVFGGMEWISIPLQIGSVMTASAALGIAVDDTVHFLSWFRRGLDAGMSRPTALLDAFQRCSGAMIHTTLICSTGLLVFAVSSFVPILHFAWLMVLLLLSALVGDLLFLPAILAGPLGRCFAASKSVPAVQQAKAANLIEE